MIIKTILCKNIEVFHQIACIIVFEAQYSLRIKRHSCQILKQRQIWALNFKIVIAKLIETQTQLQSLISTILKLKTLMI